jgi:hypothetical protein
VHKDWAEDVAAVDATLGESNARDFDAMPGDTDNVVTWTRWRLHRRDCRSRCPTAAVCVSPGGRRSGDLRGQLSAPTDGSTCGKH